MYENEKPRHMPLPEWDVKIGPILGALKTRSVWLRSDANQIKDWVRKLMAVPEFETEALDKMKEARDALANSLAAVDEAIETYGKKEKVT